MHDIIRFTKPFAKGELGNLNNPRQEDSRQDNLPNFKTNSSKQQSNRHEEGNIQQHFYQVSRIIHPIPNIGIVPKRHNLDMPFPTTCSTNHGRAKYQEVIFHKQRLKHEPFRPTSFITSIPITIATESTRKELSTYSTGIRGFSHS